MNSRSVQRASCNVRSPITIHCHAFQLIAIACFVFTVSSPPPYSLVDPAATADYTAAEYDYVVDDRIHTVELPGKQYPFISPTYCLSFYTLSIALGIAAAMLYSYSNA